MESENTKAEASWPKVIAMALGLPWFQIAGQMWKIGRKLLRGLANEGIYEVLDYKCTLELLDAEGKNAVVQKREKVRYLQDNIIAYQDQAWGDGEILLDYHCSPGVPTDQYKIDPKTYVLISLRGVRNKGDEDNFNIDWKIKNGFLENARFWGTSIHHKTKKVTVQIIFPKDRPPLKASVFESNLQKRYNLGKDALKKLSDGRHMIVWKNTKPRLYENYLLNWEW